jgi:hypothetical protein
MTTLRRELRQRFLDTILKSSLYSHAELGVSEYEVIDTTRAEAEELADALADAILEVRAIAKLEADMQARENMPMGIDAAIAAGRPITQADLDPQGNNPRQAIVDRMHKLLGPNFKPYGESPEFDRVVRFVQERESSGEKLDTFAAWAKRQKGYDPRWYYLKPDSIKGTWSLAFPAPRPAEESQDSPDFQRRLAIAATLVQPQVIPTGD